MPEEIRSRSKSCLALLAAFVAFALPATAAKLYVTQTDDRVVRYEVGPGPSSPTAPELSLPVTYPMGLVFSPAGEMFVTSHLPQGVIHPFAQPQGAANARSPMTDANLHTPRWAVFRNGDLFVAQPEGIVRCRLDGGSSPCQVVVSGLAADLHGIAVAPSGDLFVSGDASNRVSWYRFDANGGLTLKKHITGNGLNGPHDITFSPWGEMFVANGAGNTISRFLFQDGAEQPNGQITGNGLLGPIGLDFSPWGELFVAQIGGGTKPVLRFTFDAGRQAQPNGSFGSQPARDVEFLSGGTVLTSGAITQFLEDGGPVAIDAAILVEDPDDRVSRAQVSITNLRDAGAERLAAATAGTAITAVYQEPVLVLSGDDTPANYQKVLRSVSYENLSQTPDGTMRRVEIMANDGGADSNVVTRLVNVVAVNDPPVARDDHFEMVGNTLLQVDMQQGDVSIRTATPSGRGVLDNDADPAENDDFQIVGIVGCNATAAPFWCRTANDGLVVLQASGAFVVTPKPGDPAPSDSFQYQISDGPGSIVTATVTLDRRGRVWYVKNDYVPTSTAPPAGISTQPFRTLAEAAAASQPGDTIYVFEGDGTSAGLNAGITLKAGQRLIGAGVALELPSGLSGGAGPMLVRAAFSAPRIENAGGPAVSGIDALPVEIAGLSLQGSAAGVSLTTTEGFAGSGTVRIHKNAIRGGGTGVLLEVRGTAAIQEVSLADSTIAGQPAAVRLVTSGGGKIAGFSTPGSTLAGGISMDFAGAQLSGLTCAESPGGPQLPLPSSCKEAKAIGAVNLAGNTGSGTYRIQPPGAAVPVTVECDMTTGGGGWTLAGRDLVTCARGDGSSIEARARTATLNREGIRYSEVRARSIRGGSWCAGGPVVEDPQIGWGCPYANFGILSESLETLSEGCRDCPNKEIQVAVGERSDPFFVIDSENYYNRSEGDNGCAPEGVVFEVWIR